ncbi:hypothetical protein ABTN06_19220, partial [Acinetobacter baumannii]
RKPRAGRPFWHGAGQHGAGAKGCRQSSPPFGIRAAQRRASGLQQPTGVGGICTEDAGLAVLRHPCRREHAAAAAKRGGCCRTWCA